MIVYKCDRCGKELALYLGSPCYSAEPSKIVFHIDFCGGKGQYDLCSDCHKDMLEHFNRRKEDLKCTPSPN